MKIRYRAWDNSGQTREQITVYSRSRLLTTIRVRFEFVFATATYFVNWRIPRKPIKPLSFCVRAQDPAGNFSTKNCASITLK